MSKLKIKKAVYYNPPKGVSLGTDITEQARDLIKNDALYYDGDYNDVFSDDFKRMTKKLKIDLKYKGKRYEKDYNENQKINLPFDLKKEDIKKSWIDINNPYIVGFVFLVLTIIPSYFFKQPAFLYKQNAFIDQSIEVLDQTHFGEGDNVGGDKNVTNNFNEEKEDELVDKKKLFEGDIFLLSTQADHFDTTREKINYFKNFNGFFVESSGYITDISEYMSYNKELSFLVDINMSKDQKEPYLICRFDESWEQKLKTLKVPSDETFEGTIDEVLLGVVFLKDCQLK